MATSQAQNPMLNRLRDKVAIVTGGSSGIGFSIAKRLALEGAKVMICSRDISNVNAAIKILKEQNLDVEGVACHVGDFQQLTNLVTETVKRFGGIDILVANAAVNPLPFCPVLDVEVAKWDKIFDVNVKSVYLLSQAVLPYMRERGGGSILFISSYVGFTGSPTVGAYAVSKTALFGLTKSAAVTLAKDNIRVNCLAPGIIDTNFMTDLKARIGDELLKQIPMKRFGHPDEMAGLAACMVSSDASYMTGEIVAATGGQRSRL